MNTDELIKKLVDSLVKNGNLPTNIKDFCWYCPIEGGEPETIILSDGLPEEISIFGRSDD